MQKTVDQRFGDFLDAVAANNRPAMDNAVMMMREQIEREKEKPPRFMKLLLQMEDQLERLLTAHQRDEYRAMWYSEVADRHARDFYDGWVKKMPERWRFLLSEEMLAEMFRLAIEDAVGETRQGSATPPTPNEAQQELMQRFGRDS